MVIHALTCDTRECETAIGHLCLLSDAEGGESRSHDLSGFFQILNVSSCGDLSLAPRCRTQTHLMEQLKFSKYLEHVWPILSELSCSSDAGWWLLDAGAAVTVVSETHFPLFRAKLLQSPDVDRFRAANGSKMMMKGVANIVLGFSMLNSKTGKSSWKTVTLQAMVGNTNHNILSTNALCRSGWQF